MGLIFHGFTLIMQCDKIKWGDAGVDDAKTAGVVCAEKGGYL